MEVISERRVADGWAGMRFVKRSEKEKKLCACENAWVHGIFISFYWFNNSAWKNREVWDLGLKTPLGQQCHGYLVGLDPTKVQSNGDAELCGARGCPWPKPCQIRVPHLSSLRNTVSVQRMI
jgi:hypothetical protein